MQLKGARESSEPTAVVFLHIPGLMEESRIAGSELHFHGQTIGTC